MHTRERHTRTHAHSRIAYISDAVFCVCIPRTSTDGVRGVFTPVLVKRCIFGHSRLITKTFSLSLSYHGTYILFPPKLTPASVKRSFTSRASGFGTQRRKRRPIVYASRRPSRRIAHRDGRSSSRQRDDRERFIAVAGIIAHRPKRGTGGTVTETYRGG